MVGSLLPTARAVPSGLHFANVAAGKFNRLPSDDAALRRDAFDIGFLSRRVARRAGILSRGANANRGKHR